MFVLLFVFFIYKPNNCLFNFKVEVTPERLLIREKFEYTEPETTDADDWSNTLLEFINSNSEFE